MHDLGVCPSLQAAAGLAAAGKCLIYVALVRYQCASIIYISILVDTNKGNVFFHTCLYIMYYCLLLTAVLGDFSNISNRQPMEADSAVINTSAEGEILLPMSSSGSGTGLGAEEEVAVEPTVTGSAIVVAASSSQSSQLILPQSGAESDGDGGLLVGT